MNNEDAKLIIYVLAESIAARLRKHSLKCKTVSVSIRNNELVSFERQGRLTAPSFLSGDIASRAIELLTSNYRWDKPIRSLGVRGCDLVTADRHEQFDLFDDKRGEAEQLEKTVDIMRSRYGPYSIQRCAMLLDRRLTGFNPKDEHTIFPVSYFR